MQVSGFAIELIEALSKIREMLSCPELFLGFRFLMMVFGFEIWFPYRAKFIS